MSELFQIPLELQSDQQTVLPIPDEISYYVLEKDRKIYLDVDVSPDIMAIQRMILRWNMEDRGIDPKERKPIHIYIMSYGGDLNYMWSTIDMIQTSETPIYTVNVGQADSAAALIFMSGHKRFMMPRAVVVIHEGHASASGDSTKFLDASDSYRQELKRMKEYILTRTQIPPRLLSKKRNNDWEIDSAQCLEYHICDAVIDNLSEII